MLLWWLKNLMFRYKKIRLSDQIQGFCGFILNSAIDQLRALLILFTSKHLLNPPI